MKRRHKPKSTSKRCCRSWSWRLIKQCCKPNVERRLRAIDSILPSRSMGGAAAPHAARVGRRPRPLAAGLRDPLKWDEKAVISLSLNPKPRHFPFRSLEMRRHKKAKRRHETEFSIRPLQKPTRALSRPAQVIRDREETSCPLEGLLSDRDYEAHAPGALRGMYGRIGWRESDV